MLGQDHELHYVSALCFYTRSRLRFSSGKIAPALNLANAQEKVLYGLQEGTVVRRSQRAPGISCQDVAPAVIGTWDLLQSQRRLRRLLKGLPAFGSLISSVKVFSARSVSQWPWGWDNVWQNEKENPFRERSENPEVFVASANTKALVYLQHC